MVTSRNNPKIKDIVKLRKSSKSRASTGLYIVEGARLVFEAPRKQIKEIYVSDSFEQKHINQIKSLGKSYQVVSSDVFSYMSDTKTPQGILGVISKRDYNLEEILGKEEPLILMLEAIQDPGNLGTIFRTAEAAGVTGIILNGECADIYNPKTIRSTMGSIYRIPFVVVEQLRDVVGEVKNASIKIYGTHLEGDFYDEMNYKNATTFIIGNEGSGLKEDTIKLADELVQVPMKGQVESLNVSVATAILVFEAAKQRRL